MSLLSLDVATGSDCCTGKVIGQRDVGWQARVQILLQCHHRPDLLGLPLNALCWTWGLSRQPFRVASDGQAYPRVEFETWYPDSAFAEQRWMAARGANICETHAALLARLRECVRKTLYRCAALALAHRHGLPPQAVCSVASFLMGDQRDLRYILLRFASGGKGKRRLTNKPAQGTECRKPKDSEEAKGIVKPKASRIVNIPWPTGRSSTPIQAKAVRISNRKLPWPQKSRE